jgi:hypothetical protein
VGAVTPLALALLLAAEPGAPEAPGPIQDNSFLLEEAYNQEPGVIQHIGLVQQDLRTKEWLFTFTEEWPAHGQAHQVSVSVLWARLEPASGGGLQSGVGDVALNYRWQALGDGEAPVAVAPRISILAPTGSWREGRGNGGPGFQVNLPISAVLGRSFVAHFNLGATWAPFVKSVDGNGDSVLVNVGEGLVWLLHPKVNLMLEAAYTVAEFRRDAGGTDVIESFLLSPGIRGAIDTSFGLQIVPGLAFPFGFGPSAGQHQILFYLSFEHPVTRHPW